MAKDTGTSRGDADDAALDGVYLGDFEGFIGRRNELAKQLQAKGDADAAKRVRALKKPSRPAWAVNQVGGREGKLRDELLDAGAALRRAQEQLVAGKAKNADLRAVGEQERAAVSRALEAACSLADETGVTLSPAATERVRQTLHAVTLDEDVRRDFERQRLTTEHEATGLGGFSPGAPPPPGKSREKAGQGRKDRERLAARRRRDDLKAAEDKARELERRHHDAEREAEEARANAERAQRALERTTKELDKASAAAAAARERVDDLRES